MFPYRLKDYVAVIEKAAQQEPGALREIAEKAREKLKQVDTN